MAYAGISINLGGIGYIQLGWNYKKPGNLMLKSMNYIRSIFSIFIFSLLSSCGDNGSFFNNRMSGEEFSDPQEAKLIKYYTPV